MSTISLITGFSLAFLAALILTPVVSSLARRNKWVDIPDGKRTVHKQPTPRAGGLAIMVAFMMGIGYFYMLRASGAVFVSFASFVALATGVLCGVVFFEERPTLGLVVACGLTMSAVWLLQEKEQPARAADDVGGAPGAPGASGGPER